jgi:hypothetical protein
MLIYPLVIDEKIPLHEWLELESATCRVKLNNINPLFLYEDLEFYVP